MEIEENGLNNNHETEENDVPVFATHVVEEDVDKYPMEIEDSDSEEEDQMIKPSDNILLAGKIESEFSSLEVYIFEEKTENLYVHHEIFLNSFPVCIDWLGANFS